MNVTMWIIIAMAILTVVAVLLDSIKHLLHFGVRDTQSEVVRIAIIHSNSVFLIPSKIKDAHYEHPLSATLHRRETKEQAIECLMGSSLSLVSEKPKFLLKYQIDGDERDLPSRIVHLYVLNVEDKSLYTAAFPHGSFFTCSAIDDLSRRDLLTPAFMDEYAYLRNTVILCNTLIANKNRNKEK